MLPKIQYSNGPIYTLALLGFKVALLTSYLRIGGFIKLYRNVIIATLVAVTTNQVLLTFLVIFNCTPVSKIWDPSIKGHCVHSVALYYVIAGIFSSQDPPYFLPLTDKLIISRNEYFV